MRDCLACGTTTEALPLPHQTQSMLSDGRISQHALAKSRCPACGLIQHVELPDISTVRSFYGAEYDLAVRVSPSDVARSAAIADILLAHLHDVPSRVLEIGCGSGHTLRALAAAWPNTAFLGCEAAPQIVASAIRCKQPRITILESFAEDLPLPNKGSEFNLVFSINVFEHAADPVAFLKAKAVQLAKGGKIAVVCPNCEPPNMELVFQDHIHSFTPHAAIALARRAGLTLVEYEAAPTGLSDFQLFVFALTGEKTVTATSVSHENYVAYLDGWVQLDTVLSDRLSSMTGRAFVFGAGEMAALLRAYTPETWGMVEACVVDDLAGARELGVPIKRLEDVRLGADDVLIVGVHPRSQKAVAQRLMTSGATILTFDDLIPR